MTAAEVEVGFVVFRADEGSVGVLGLGGGEAVVADAEVFVPDAAAFPAERESFALPEAAPASFGG